MSVWKHHLLDPQTGVKQVLSETCAYCGKRMKFLDGKPGANEWVTRIRVCSICGWWTASRLDDADSSDEPGLFERGWMGASALLTKLDLDDISTPIQILKDYLVARFADRFVLHPRMLELLVADIFRDQGYDVWVTAYQKDGGFDVILNRGSKSIVGVQVKRSRNTISVSQIREFTGALYLGGMHRGVFVTTSSYTGPARSAASQAKTRATPVELIDSSRLFDALKLQRTPLPVTYTEFYDMYGDIPLSDVEIRIILGPSLD